MLYGCFWYYGTCTSVPLFLEESPDPTHAQWDSDLTNIWATRNTSTWFCWKWAVVILAVCGRALSCWNTACGQSGSCVAMPQGPISRQTTHSHISGDSSRKMGPIVPYQDPDLDQQYAERRCACHLEARGGPTRYWFSSLDNVVCLCDRCV